MSETHDASWRVNLADVDSHDVHHVTNLMKLLQSRPEGTSINAESRKLVYHILHVLPVLWHFHADGFMILMHQVSFRSP